MLLCPSNSCKGGACSGDLVVEKDVPACGIDTSQSTPVGTVYRLVFEVYDTGGLSATATRVVQVITPCAEGQSLCSDGQCHNVDCPVWAGLQALSSQADTPTSLEAPVLVLLPTSLTNYTALAWEHPSNQTVLTAYGQPAALSLLPCASGLALPLQAQCAAAAVQVASNGSWVDVSSQVTVQDVSTNITARQERIQPCLLWLLFLAPASCFGLWPCCSPPPYCSCLLPWLWPLAPASCFCLLPSLLLPAPAYFL